MRNFEKFIFLFIVRLMVLICGICLNFPIQARPSIQIKAVGKGLKYKDEVAKDRLEPVLIQALNFVENGFHEDFNDINLHAYVRGIDGEDDIIEDLFRASLNPTPTIRREIESDETIIVYYFIPKKVYAIVPEFQLNNPSELRYHLKADLLALFYFHKLGMESRFPRYGAPWLIRGIINFWIEEADRNPKNHKYWQERSKELAHEIESYTGTLPSVSDLGKNTIWLDSVPGARKIFNEICEYAFIQLRPTKEDVLRFFSLIPDYDLPSAFAIVFGKDLKRFERHVSETLPGIPQPETRDSDFEDAL